MITKKNLLAVAAVASLVALAIPASAAASSSKTSPADSMTTSSHKKGKAPAVKVLNNKLCPVTGKPVGSMEKGAHIIYKGYNIGLCCNSCKKDFKTNGDKYLEAALKETDQK